ncbi:MAG: sugar transporter [Rhodocyclaceae bacterium]|nr:MAG: sugar transporter [Rhodocyclaceae bacterium]
MRVLLLILSLLSLAGCGTKTPLILSPPPVKASPPASSSQATPLTMPRPTRHDDNNAAELAQ